MNVRLSSEQEVPGRLFKAASRARTALYRAEFGGAYPLSPAMYEAEYHLICKNIQQQYALTDSELWEVMEWAHAEHREIA